MLKKPCLNVQNLQHKFLELFQKFIRFGDATLPLLNNNEEKQDEEKHIAANISVVSAADGVV